MRRTLAAAVLALAVAGCTSATQSASPPSSSSPAASRSATASATPAHHRHRHHHHARAVAHGSACGAGLWWAHVYHPDRLHVVRQCMTVRGRVTEVRAEPDGDLHILLATRPALVNSANDTYEHGDLVLEEICQRAVTQADAVAACQGVPHNLTVPSVGDEVTVTGVYVLDADHGWMEIHPVTSLTVTGFAPVAAPPPAPAGCYSKTPSGGCYEPGEYCPTADAGMTGVAGDGKTIVCRLVSGRYHWED